MALPGSTLIIAEPVEQVQKHALYEKRARSVKMIAGGLLLASLVIGIIWFAWKHTLLLIGGNSWLVQVGGMSRIKGSPQDIARIGRGTVPHVNWSDADERSIIKHPFFQVTTANANAPVGRRHMYNGNGSIVVDRPAGTTAAQAIPASEIIANAGVPNVSRNNNEQTPAMSEAQAANTNAPPGPCQSLMNNIRQTAMDIASGKISASDVSTELLNQQFQTCVRGYPAVQ